jgi:hypothetical protein
MAGEPPTPNQRRHMLRRAGLTQLSQLFLLLGSISAILIGLSVLAIILQAQRDEVRNADWMIVVATTAPDPALITHVIAQQRRNGSPRIVILGAAAQRTAEQLKAAGSSVTHLEPADAGPLIHQLRAYAPEAQAPQTALIIAPPEQLALLHKMSRDLGMNAFVSAPPRLALRIGPTLGAALSYWRYTLAGEA